jgi:hypothetical protein
MSSAPASGRLAPSQNTGAAPASSPARAAWRLASSGLGAGERHQSFALGLCRPSAAGTQRVVAAQRPGHGIEAHPAGSGHLGHRAPARPGCSDLVLLLPGELGGTLGALHLEAERHGTAPLVVPAPAPRRLGGDPEGRRDLGPGCCPGLDQLHRREPPAHHVARFPAPSRHAPQHHDPAGLVLDQVHAVGHPHRPGRAQRQRASSSHGDQSSTPEYLGYRHTPIIASQRLCSADFPWFYNGSLFSIPGVLESELSENYVLFATATLPAGYPLGDGQGGGHAWLVVGYSSFGPMIVSWGQEVQVSWANFDNWTTGVWALGASQT